MVYRPLRKSDFSLQHSGSMTSPPLRTLYPTYFNVSLSSTEMFCYTICPTFGLPFLIYCFWHFSQHPQVHAQPSHVHHFECSPPPCRCPLSSFPFLGILVCRGQRGWLIPRVPQIHWHGIVPLPANFTSVPSKVPIMLRCFQFNWNTKMGQTGSNRHNCGSDLLITKAEF